jgi:MerR family transcriptional regulator, light-induced transcriptional regulator
MAFAKYTVNEVEERTGVQATTLRQWERRYGVPRPERSPSGYRLYSDDDIALIEAMKGFIAEGVPASRAAELAKQPLATGPRPLEDLREELLGALLDLDESRADRVLSEAYALHPVDAVMLELLQGAMIEIGRRWQEGAVSVSVEHFASAYVSGKLRALLNLSADGKTGASVIVACAPLEQHELGALVLAVMLRRAGYRVFYIGANTPVADLAEMTVRLNPSAVLISASAALSAERLVEGHELLARFSCPVVYGGAAFNEAPELAKSLGGHYLGPSAREAVTGLPALIGRQEMGE